MIPPFVAGWAAADIHEATRAVEQILRTGRLVLGPYTAAFEEAVAASAGTSHAVAVNSGSSALEIIARAMGLPGKTALVPVNTNFATAAALLRAGVKVELYDSALFPNVADILRRLSDKVAAVVVVHIGGYLSPHLPYLVEACRSEQVMLIEDAAHAHGAHLAGVPAGSFGRAAAWSYFATKVISTGGEGGALTTDDFELDRLARSYRDQGKGSRDQHVVLGNSWRMSEIGAALGVLQLAGLTADLVARRAAIDRYAAALDGTGLTFPGIPMGSQVSGHKCIALLDPTTGIGRAELHAVVRARGVELARGVYEQPLHRHSIFSDLNVHDTFTAAERFADRHVCLPLWRAPNLDVVDRVIDVVAASINLLRG